MTCAVCGEKCEQVYYQSLEDAQCLAMPGSVVLGVPWGPGWRSLYFNAEHDVDFCGADCSLAWHEAKEH